MFLLFAEDEFYIREGVLNQIDWNTLGITKVKTCSDGKAAEELLKLKPDILLTDIRMPYKNGLELATIAKEQDPDCEVIIISSYSDKEYLFKAISLSAVAYIEKPIEIEELCKSILDAVKRRKRSVKLSRKDKNNAEHFDVSDFLPCKDESYSHTITLALEYLKEHYKEPSLSLNSISEYLHINSCYLSDCFKKETGMKLKKLITHVRIQSACYLLRSTTLSVNDIANEVGYRNSNYFSTSFKQETGLSPNEFREQPKEDTQ